MATIAKVARKPVFFVATRKRNEPVVVQFYTKTGKPVAFDSVRKVRTKSGVFFYANSQKSKRH